MTHTLRNTFVRSLLFQRSGGYRFFIPTDHSRLRTEVATSAWLSTRRKNSEVSRDIDNRDGTVGDHNNWDIDDLNKETKALSADGLRGQVSGTRLCGDNKR